MATADVRRVRFLDKAWPAATAKTPTVAAPATEIELELVEPVAPKDSPWTAETPTRAADGATTVKHSVDTMAPIARAAAAVRAVEDVIVGNRKVYERRVQFKDLAFYSPYLPTSSYA